MNPIRNVMGKIGTSLANFIEKFTQNDDVKICYDQNHKLVMLNSGVVTV